MFGPLGTIVTLAGGLAALVIGVIPAALGGLIGGFSG